MHDLEQCEQQHEMMNHVIKLFEGVHAELGGPSYPFQDTPEDAALPGAHDAD